MSADNFYLVRQWRTAGVDKFAVTMEFASDEERASLSEAMANEHWITWFPTYTQAVHWAESQDAEYGVVIDCDPQETLLDWLVTEEFLEYDGERVYLTQTSIEPPAHLVHEIESAMAKVRTEG